MEDTTVITEFFSGLVCRIL